MLKIYKLNLIAITLSSLLIAEMSEYSINYFGNLSGALLNRDDLYLTKQDSGKLYNDVDLYFYSKVGAQLSLYSNNFEFYLQGLSYVYDGKPQLDLTLLNGKYRFNDNLSFRAGRLPINLFLSTESINIDYLYTWAKAPFAIYEILPFEYFDGVDIIYQRYFGDLFLKATLVPYGYSSKDINFIFFVDQNRETELNYIQMLKLVFEYQNFEFKTIFAKAKATIPPSNSGLTLMRRELSSRGYSEVAESYEWKDRVGYFNSIGVNYDNGTLFFNSEFVAIRGDTLLPDINSYYVMSGYRYDLFSPYIMYSVLDADRDDSVETRLNGSQSSVVQYIDSQLNRELSKLHFDFNTISIGLRYELFIGMALKLQIDRIIGLESSREGFLNFDEGASTKEPTYQFIFGLSFAF